MDDVDTKASISELDIQYFVGNLRSICDHDISDEGWEQFRRGPGIDSQTERQKVMRGPGGTGLLWDRLSREEWDEASEAIAAAHRQSRLNDTLDEIAKERRDAAADALFERGFGSATEFERNWLRREIENHVSLNRWDALEALLQDAHRLGVQAATRKRDYGGTWAYVGYFLRGLEALIELLIAWRIFVAVDSTFERVAVCLLLLTYARAADARQSLEYRFEFLSAEVGSRFMQTYRLLKERRSTLWAGDMRAANACKGLSRAGVNSLISSGKHWLLTAFAVGALLWVLL